MMKNDKNLQEVMAKLKKEYGNSIICASNSIPSIKENIVSTGIMGLDMALGVGGIRKGSIVEIYGPESVGKTTLALQLAKQFQQLDKPVLYIDSEKTLTKESIERVGINPETFYMFKTDTLECALDACRTSARAFSAIIIDSLIGLMANGQKMGDVGNSHAGLFSRLMSETLPMLVPVLEENQCTLIITNQLREKIGVMFGNPEYCPGGRALKYYTTARLEIRRIEPIKSMGNTIGNRVRTKVVKNKIAAPFKETEFDIMFDYGISIEGDIIDCAIDKGIITRNGASCIYNRTNIGRGRENAKKFLMENPKIADEISDELHKMYLSA